MSIQTSFEEAGGLFLTSAEEISNKLKNVHGFVLDWDGVFNNGIKDNPNGSPFSEPDSMGLNMLRFSYWLLNGKLPVVAIITGENNRTALEFAKREHLNAVYLGAKNKMDSLLHLTTKFSLDPKQLAFFFDDILDLNVAKACQLSFGVRRKGSPLFLEFLVNNQIGDYISAQVGGKHAVREISELLIGLQGNYNECVVKRMEHQGEYQEYLSLRNSVDVTEISAYA